MAHSFEQSQPGHSRDEISIPRGHGGIDQKYGKGMRSPIVGHLPMENGLESPAVDSGISHDEGGL